MDMNERDFFQNVPRCSGMDQNFNTSGGKSKLLKV